jgi:Bacterial dnaA protein helix-turn-helix
MIEAVEFSTEAQRQQHQHYQEIHRKFFPRPPVFPKLIEPMPVKAEPPPAPPDPPQPPPIKFVGFDQTRLRMRIIRRMVCQAFDISREAIMSTRRTHDIVRPRQVYSYLVTRLTRASTPMIARSLGQDHTTIIHAVRKIELRVNADHDFGVRINQLERRIRTELGEDSKPRSCIARYVVHEQVADYFLLGWMWAANLNEYSALLIWPCDCQHIEPKQ